METGLENSWDSRGSPFSDIFIGHPNSLGSMTYGGSMTLKSCGCFTGNQMTISDIFYVKNLEVNQTYFYQVSCEYGHDVFKSDIFMFKTLSNDKKQTVKLLVYGDMGSKSGKLTLSALQDELSNGQYQAIFHNGDFGYDLDSNGGSVGDEFLDMIQPIAAQFPYMTSPGNHELAHDLHHYRLRFSMPGTPWPMPFEKLWYSFDIGPVHFISFSSEVYFIHNQDFTCKQYDWLLEDLTKANQNREQTPWVIALGHRPMYCTNSNLDDCTPHFWGQWVKRG
ncbi:Hypothetical predicted protein [Mytilus galloprovincialis]|uniref:Calcineurin-like phosphoesterase domain-containing protein n=1 Tax=Mytilus galloprovincialis TaxID=29158 RepID=A0A8B6ERJ7_MYTGA|nr:Hypothetical predicted protein [Mytilus galloprovincialis]